MPLERTGFPWPALVGPCRVARVSSVSEGVREGTAPFDLGGEVAETWFRVTGDVQSSDAGAPAPLVVLHGGPGATHDYLLSIADLAHGGRAVVHYDQLGNGRSTHFPDR